VAASVAGVIEPTLQAAETARSAGRPMSVDALSGAHLWADRFDGSLEDIFKLQDKGQLRGDADAVAGLVHRSF
jgi:hypothetical protein